MNRYEAMAKPPCGGTLAITLLAPHAVTAIAAPSRPRLSSFDEASAVVAGVALVDTPKGYDR